jgi:ElaB/YqjD/DUF883 family membrane-anchored ribosome-binding protein
MADANQNQELPEGTDAVIEGAANTGAIEIDQATTDDGDVAVLTIEDTAEAPATDRAFLAGGAAGVSDRLRTSGEKLSGQVGDKARGFVTQGLERTSEALANVSRMVGDTADGIEERLGADYGEYARRAAGAIENAANSLASKDPDELIDDTRTFVRNSPGIALAGAAVVGFVLARLVKSGLPASRNDNDDA